MNDKARFEVTHYPLPKNAQGKTFWLFGESRDVPARMMQC
jgi:hypothetical protein